MSNYNRRRDGSRHEENYRRRWQPKVNAWIWVGVVLLIVLLILWLTIADLWGDTDVAAAILPTASFPVC